MTTRRHPDAKRLDDLAYRMTRDAKLVGQLADRTHHAHTHIAQQLSTLGWPRRSGDPSRGSSELTSVERDAHTSYQYTAIREDLRDQITRTIDEYHAMCSHIKATGLVIHAASVTGLTKAERHQLTAAGATSVCSDNQHGKHAADEWGDALCHLPGVKGGLCQNHYMAWYRARLRDGIDTTRDHGAA